MDHQGNNALQVLDLLDINQQGSRKLNWNKLHNLVIHETVNSWRLMYKTIGGPLLVDILTEKDDEDMSAITQAIRYSRENIVSILGIFNSSEAMQLLSSQDRKGRIMAENVFDRHGPTAFMDVLLSKSATSDRSVLAEFSEHTRHLMTILQVFSAKENLKSFLTMCDGGNLVMVGHVLKSQDAVNAVSYIYDFLGVDMLLDVLLLKMEESWPVITAMNDQCMTEFLPRIIKESSDRLFEKDQSQLDVLQYILMSASACAAITIICATYGKQKCMALLLDKNTNGDTVLSFALKKWDPDCFANIMEGFAREEVIELLSGQDEKNCSAMYHLVNSEDGDQFLKVLSESLHLGIKEFIEALLCTEETKNYSLETIKSWLDETLMETGQRQWGALLTRLRWTVDQIKNSCYLLFTQPSILVISIKTGRGDLADQESNAIIQAFELLGLMVTPKYDLTAQEIMDAIEEQQSKPESKCCQIVVIMSHGSVGCIHDKDAKSVHINALIEKMAPDSHENSPKVLILQCCQIDPQAAAGDIANAGDSVDSTSGDRRNGMETDALVPLEQRRMTSDRPRVPCDQPRRPPSQEFSLKKKQCCVVSSCVPGEYSFRNEFIPKIAAALKNLDPYQDLYEAYLQAHKSLNISEQTPQYSSTMKLKVCLRNIFTNNGQDDKSGDEMTPM